MITLEINHKAYVQSVDLKKHMKVHTAEKPFKCSVCKKGFSLSADRLNHMKTHTGNVLLRVAISSII